ncbi:hypothetical protein GYMLUDRAFT_39843 [Collybiopsis luxurians FD-317 M1]|nr:hypothetical protein GYMLUDRAFT_39843 [Collybiopsis luxurians FD-317 M1]
MPQVTDWFLPFQRIQKPGDLSVMKFSWIPDRGPNSLLNEPRLFRDCDGMFGVPEHFYSFRAYHQNGCPTTNHLFLPSPFDNPDDFRWDVFHESEEEPDSRSLRGRAAAFAGHSLVSAKDLPSLTRAVLHAHIGKLEILSWNRCLDLSIGKIQMVDEPIRSNPFDEERSAGGDSSCL